MTDNVDAESVTPWHHIKKDICQAQEGSERLLRETQLLAGHALSLNSLKIERNNNLYVRLISVEDVRNYWSHIIYFLI